MTEIDLEINTQGLLCPLPLLRLKKGLSELQGGQVIRLTATDPAAHLDIGVFLEQAGHLLVNFTKQDNIQIFVIQKRT